MSHRPKSHTAVLTIGRHDVSGDDSERSSSSDLGHSRSCSPSMRGRSKSPMLQAPSGKRRSRARLRAKTRGSSSKSRKASRRRSNRGATQARRKGSSSPSGRKSSSQARSSRSRGRNTKSMKSRKRGKTKEEKQKTNGLMPCDSQDIELVEIEKRQDSNEHVEILLNDHKIHDRSEPDCWESKFTKAEQERQEALEKVKILEERVEFLERMLHSDERLGCAILYDKETQKKKNDYHNVEYLTATTYTPVSEDWGCMKRFLAWLCFTPEPEQWLFEEEYLVGKATELNHIERQMPFKPTRWEPKESAPISYFEFKDTSPDPSFFELCQHEFTVLAASVLVTLPALICIFAYADALGRVRENMAELNLSDDMYRFDLLDGRVTFQYIITLMVFCPLFCCPSICSAGHLAMFGWKVFKQHLNLVFFFMGSGVSILIIVLALFLNHIDVPRQLWFTLMFVNLFIGIGVISKHVGNSIRCPHYWKQALMTDLVVCGIIYLYCVVIPMLFFDELYVNDDRTRLLIIALLQPISTLVTSFIYHHWACTIRRARPKAASLPYFHKMLLFDLYEKFLVLNLNDPNLVCVARAVLCGSDVVWEMLLRNMRLRYYHCFDMSEKQAVAILKSWRSTRFDCDSYYCRKMSSVIASISTAFLIYVGHFAPAGSSPQLLGDTLHRLGLDLGTTLAIAVLPLVVVSIVPTIDFSLMKKQQYRFWNTKDVSFIPFMTWFAAVDVAMFCFFYDHMLLANAQF